MRGRIWRLTRERLDVPADDRLVFIPDIQHVLAEDAQLPARLLEGAQELSLLRKGIILLGPL
jgi:hypothetical protein